MALRGTRSFLVHYGGKWGSNGNKYIGGKSVWLNEIDGDEFCLIDLLKDVEDKCQVNGVKIQWLRGGSIKTIENDTHLMEMWDHIVVHENLFHLYVMESDYSGSEKVNAGSNKALKTPTKKVSPAIKKKDLTPTRRAPRLQGSFVSMFSTTSKNPVV